MVGDRRFEMEGTAPRKGLHALRLEVTDPRTGDRLKVEALPDSGFLALLIRPCPRGIVGPSRRRRTSGRDPRRVVQPAQLAYHRL